MKNRRTDALSTAAMGDEDYRSWLKRLKSQVRSAQVKAAIRVNIELLQLYWNMGHDIAEKHLDAAYGSGFFDRLSRDLKAEFPHMEGFSPRNLRYIKEFYLFYSPWILQQPVAKLGEGEILQQPVAKLGEGEILQQPVAKLEEGEILQQPVAKLEESEILQQPVAKLEEGEILHQAVAKLEEGEILHQAGAKLEKDQNRHQAGDELRGGEILQQPVAKLGDGEILQQPVAKLGGSEILQQPVAKLGGSEILQQPVAKLEDSQNRQQFVDEFKMLFSIPWGHHVEIFTHAQSVEEALFYISKTLENGWSRNVLANMMEADLYHTQGTAITNFAEKLPAPESDLAQQTLKDPYCFDFITLRKQYTERELEDALMENITRFLLELGNGFSFIGRQYRLEVGGEEFFIDLLFYHLNLRRYVIVELKAGEFKPTDAGQLGFYVKAVNEQLKHPGDNDAIGLIICRQKNRLVAEYALKSSTQLLGISEYRLTKLLPRNFKSSLPSIQDIESQFTADETQVGSKGPQVEPHAIDVSDHRTSKPTNRTSKPTSNRTSKPTSNRTSKPTDRTSKPTDRTSKPTDRTSNVQVEAQEESNHPQVDSSTRPQVEAEKEVRATEVTNYRTSSEQVESETVQVSEQVESGTVQVSEQVKRLITSMSNKWQSASDLRMITNILHRPTFVKNYLEPALKLELIEMTQPDSPRSPTQKYRLTTKGKAVARKLKREEGKK